MEVDNTFRTSRRLQTLHKWLSYELSGVVLFGISFFYSAALTLLLIAALVFIPYMLYVLFAEERYGWILGFFITVAFPAVLSYYLFGINMVVSTSFLAGGQLLGGYIAIAFLLAYCFVLKNSIPAMLEE